MDNFRFYKYRHIDRRLLESLSDGTIYFSNQESLNDPFDCELDIEKAIKNAADSLDGNEADSLRTLLKYGSDFERFQANVNNFGIFSACFEMDENQTLLWAHYANDHKGLCVMYEIPMEFLDDEDNVVAVSKVTYDQDATLLRGRLGNIAFQLRSVVQIRIEATAHGRRRSVGIERVEAVGSLENGKVG